MERVSVIIPSRNEEYLKHTVEDVLNKSRGDVEVIVVLDGHEYNPLPEDTGIRTIINKEPLGMRGAINQGASVATGKYLMKCDAHCCFDEGFDIKLAKDCDENWTVVPRSYAIDKKRWDRHSDLRLYKDFQYIAHPNDKKHSFKGCDWPEYGVRVNGHKIVDLMTSQGSCWFMHKSFFDKIGGLDEENYGKMGAEAQEVCLKTWLSGGRYVLNRNTWYCHKAKLRSLKHRGYRKPMGEWKKSRKYAKECWLNNKWEGQVRNLDWLIDKFKPVPGWHTRLESVNTQRFVMEKFKLNYGVESMPRVINGLNRRGLVNLWSDLGYKIGAEIGVERGLFSKMMLENIPNLKMYLVDPYKNYKGQKIREGNKECRESSHELLGGYDVEWLEELSETAAHKVKDKSLDFVYIDGNHKYDWVMTDIILWQRKVRSGGMVCGHDYRTDGKSYRREVAKAVDDYTRRHGIVPVYLTDIRNKEIRSDRHASWFWIKG